MMKMIAFDLDNTLYNHKQYVECAYNNISNFVSEKYFIDKKKYYRWIFTRWLEKGSSYNKIFKESYDYFGLKNFKKDIKNILKIYRTSKPNLKLYDGINEILDKLEKKYKLILITDGKSKTQNYKIDNLNIRSYFNNIYISGEYGDSYYKPSIKMFNKCLADNKIDNNKIIYIGDNPLHDYPPCKELNIEFIRIKAGEYKNHEIDNSVIELNLNEIKILDKVVDKIYEENISNNIY